MRALFESIFDKEEEEKSDKESDKESDWEAATSQGRGPSSSSILRGLPLQSLKGPLIIKANSKVVLQAGCQQ